MNTNQRKFLVDKITEKTKIKIKALEDSRPDIVMLNAHMLHKVMSNDFEIQPTEQLRKLIVQKALGVGKNKTDRDDWLGNNWGVANKKNVVFTIEEFFVIPKEYQEMVDDANKQRDAINAQIKELKVQLDTLEVRIMLASDKTLQNLINEVDDMGDLSLVDTKIKLLA